MVAPELPRAGRRVLVLRGHVATPKLPRAGRREAKPRGYVVAPELPSREAGAVVLT
jgi:hypothetical protein